MTPPQRIALTGYSRTGKDEIGIILVNEYGYKRRAFGDIIKRQLNDLCIQELGFEAYTENDDEKLQIRKLLELWGYVNYDNVFNEFFERLPRKCVNTRLFRLKEAVEWKKQGGIIWEVKRSDTYPQTLNEEKELELIRNNGLIDDVIYNFGSLDLLRENVLKRMAKSDTNRRTNPGNTQILSNRSKFTTSGVGIRNDY